MFIKDIIAAVSIQVLVGTTLYTHVFELFADVESTLEHTAVDYVLELGAHESITLAGFTWRNSTQKYRRPSMRMQVPFLMS